MWPFDKCIHRSSFNDYLCIVQVWNKSHGVINETGFACSTCLVMAMLGEVALTFCGSLGFAGEIFKDANVVDWLLGYQCSIVRDSISRSRSSKYNSRQSEKMRDSKFKFIFDHIYLRREALHVTLCAVLSGIWWIKLLRSYRSLNKEPMFKMISFFFWLGVKAVGLYSIIPALVKVKTSWIRPYII